MSVKRILCFCEQWGTGGIEAFITSSIVNMRSDGLKIDIVAAKLCDSRFTDELSARGVDFYELSGKLRAPENFSLFKKLLKKNSYDVIHFNVFHCLTLAYVKIAKKAGVPSRIVHAHGSGLRRSLTSSLKLLLHRACRRLWLGCETQRLACSESASRFFFGDGSAVAVNNGIDAERFRFSREKRDVARQELGVSDPGTKVIGHVGRMSSEKNQEFLIKAFAEYKKTAGSSLLLLVGDGDDADSLKKLASELGISESVIFYGNSDRVDKLMCAMDLFVFPSISEGFGIAAVEAQASGLFLIKSDGVPEDVAVTENVKSLSLELGSKAWAEEFTSALAKTIDRKTAADEVIAKGADAFSVAEKIRTMYTAEVNI